MDSTRGHRVRFLLPEKDEWNDGKWLDDDEMRKRFDLKLSRLVIPPPPKLSHQLKNPDELLVELKKKLMAIDRTIQFREAIIEEEDSLDLQPQMKTLTTSETPSEDLNEKSDKSDNLQLPAQQDQLTIQEQQQQQQPQQEKQPSTNHQQASEQLKQTQANQNSPTLTSKVGPKRPPLPPNKRPKEEPKNAPSSSPGAQAKLQRQDSLPRSFKTRRRSFRDFSKRQFQRALSAMNLSKTGTQDQKLLRSNSFDTKLDGSSLTDSMTGLQKDERRIRSKSSSSLMMSNLRLRFHRFPSNIYKKSKKGDSSGQTTMKRRSSWSKLFSSWSSNLQMCTRVQTDDD